MHIEEYLIVLPYSSYTQAASVSSLLVDGEPQLLFLGEVHENPYAVDTAARTLADLCHRERLSFLGLEHFNSEQQGLLDEWVEDNISWEELVDEYRKGPEGFNLGVYRPLLEKARECGARVVGVMPPRNIANKYAKTGILDKSFEPPIPVDPYSWKGYMDVLPSLFPRSGPMASIPLERLAAAQSFKDSYSAARIAETFRGVGDSGVVLMGWAHIETPGAVPDRVESLLGLNNYTVAGFHTPGEARLLKSLLYLVKSSYWIIVPDTRDSTRPR